MTDKTQAKADRRNFLKLAGATAATGTVATSTAVVAAPTEAPAPDALYTETAHVRRYYDSAR